MTQNEIKNTMTSVNIGKSAKIRFTAEELCEFLAANYNMRTALLMLLGRFTQKEAVLRVWRVADDADLVRRCNGLSQIVYRLKGYLRIAFEDNPVVQDFLEAA